MDFSRTFYMRKSSKNKLFFSKNLFDNYIRDNKSAKKLLYVTNYKSYNSFSTSPTNSSSKNYMTKSNLKTINKLISEKLDKTREVKTQLKNFYKNEIKLKIRKSNKYKSLFEKTEINNSNNFKSELEKHLITLKLKSNKKRINYLKTYTNNSNNLNINTFHLNSNNCSKINNNKSKTKSKNKTLNLNNGEVIKKTYYTTTYITKESDNENKKENIRNRIYKNILEKSVNQRHPPYSVDFREENLSNFYAQTKNLCYKKYFLYLKRNELEIAKWKSYVKNILNDIEINRYMKFKQLLKPYTTDFERYRYFLKETVIFEIKEEEKLKLKESNLIADIFILNKDLINLQKNLKSYIDDKFFLLCVKNSTINLDKFDYKYKIEFQKDLQNLETLKRYIKEISELTTEENIVNKNKKIDIINPKNPKYSKEIPFILKLQKIRENFEESFNHQIKFEQIFDSTEEFIYKVNASQTRIENLLKKGSLVETELANLRDFISHNSDIIEKVKDNIFSEENKLNEYRQSLIDVKDKYEYLLNYKKKIIKFKKYKISFRIVKKIKSLISNILDTHDKTVSAIFLSQNKKIRENPDIMLSTLEKMVNFLIKFKEKQKIINSIEYMKIAKIIEKNNRLSVIEQKKEELKIKAENKLKEIMEKNTKIFLFKDKRTCLKYKPIKINIDDDLNKNSNKDEDKSIDIFY